MSKVRLLYSILQNLCFPVSCLPLDTCLWILSKIKKCPTYNPVTVLGAVKEALCLLVVKDPSTIADQGLIFYIKIQQKSPKNTTDKYH